MNFNIKYIDANHLRAEIKSLEENARKIRVAKESTLNEKVGADGQVNLCQKLYLLIDSLQQEKIDMGEVSDGYHTFNELYYYRMLYNAAFFNDLAYYDNWAGGSWKVEYDVHKSKKHFDGEDCFGGGWFIVMAELPTGQISNHYEMKYWDYFNIPEKEKANVWDGHTPQEAADRLHKYLQQEQPASDFCKENCKGYRETGKCFIDGPCVGKQETSEEQPVENPQKRKFVFPKFLYARTTDNKTIDVLYAPQNLEAIEYVRNDFVKPEQPVIKKSNALFDKCVENCDPAVMKEVSDNVDKMLASEKLEKEIKRMKDWWEHNIGKTMPGFENIAHHFAEWGAEHLKK